MRMINLRIIFRN